MRITHYSYPVSRVSGAISTPFFRSPWSSLESEFSRLFDGAPFEGGTVRRFPIDLYEDAQNAFVRAELPGVARDQISVEVHEGVLSIQAKRSSKQGETESVASYSRSVSLPDGIDADKVSAAYENGILTVTLPKKESVQPKKVTIAIK